MERYEIARLFQIDPTVLQKLPRKEYEKRKEYYRQWQKVVSGSQKGVTVDTDWEPEAGANIIEG